MHADIFMHVYIYKHSFMHIYIPTISRNTLNLDKILDNLQLE